MFPTDELKDFVEYKMPYPIAVLYRNYRNLDEDNWQERTRLLGELFEVITKILASITIESYLLEGATDASLNERLKSFARPSLGHWLEALREGLKHFDDKERTPLVDRLHSFLFRRLEEAGDVSSEAKQLAASLDIAVPRPSASRLALFDLLVALRNKTAHGARLSLGECRERFDCIRPLVEALLADLKFLADYPLLYVSEVKVSSGLYDHVVQNCNGKDFERQRFRAEQPLEDHQLYVCYFEEANSAPAFALSLSPFMVFEYCGECKREQVFFLNALHGKKIEFLSYQCGHVLQPAEHVTDLKDIFDFFSGKVSLEELFRGRTLGKGIARVEVGPTRDQKALAARLVALGDACLQEERIEEAIKHLREATALDPDSEHAHFLLGTGLLYQGEFIEDAIRELSETTRLNPRNALAQLALGKIFMEDGDVQAARGRLQLSLVADPADQEARGLLQRLGPRNEEYRGSDTEPTQAMGQGGSSTGDSESTEAGGG